MYTGASRELPLSASGRAVEQHKGARLPRLSSCRGAGHSSGEAGHADRGRQNRQQGLRQPARGGQHVSEHQAALAEQ